METRKPGPDRGTFKLATFAFGWVTAASALRPLWELPHGGLCAGLYFAGLVSAATFVWRRRTAPWLSHLARLAEHPAALGLAVAALCVFDAVFLRWNNSLKAVGRDATGDDAVIEAFRAFAAGLPMYSARLYDGAPISPGPLWVLLNGWLAAPGVYFLLTALYLVAVLALLEPGRRAGFVLLALLNPLVWTNSGTGHDLLAIGLGLLGCQLWARRASGAGAAHALGLAAASGILATSRIVYLGFPIFLALHAEGLPRRSRWCIGVLGSALALGAHAGFMAQAAQYQPAHLLDRGLRHIGLAGMIAGGVGTLAALAVTWRSTSARLGSPLGFAVALLVPHVAIALGMLVGGGGRIDAWEGANYFLPAIPALAYALLRAVPSPGPVPRESSSVRSLASLPGRSPC